MRFWFLVVEYDHCIFWSFSSCCAFSIPRNYEVNDITSSVGWFELVLFHMLWVGVYLTGYGDRCMTHDSFLVLLDLVCVASLSAWANFLLLAFRPSCRLFPNVSKQSLKLAKSTVRQTLSSCGDQGQHLADFIPAVRALPKVDHVVGIKLVVSLLC